MPKLHTIATDTTIRAMDGGHNIVSDILYSARCRAIDNLFKVMNIRVGNLKSLTNYRNEIDMYIDAADPASRNLISHHSAGDNFGNTVIQDLRKFFILDDVVGFNNFISLKNQAQYKFIYKMKIPPSFTLENGSKYKLIAYIDKKYRVHVVNYILDDFNKKEDYREFDVISLPRHLHALYKKTNIIHYNNVGGNGDNRYTNYINAISTNLSKSMYIEIPRPFKVFPHYGSACVFNSFISILSFCGEELYPHIKNKKLLKVLTENNTNTVNLEKSILGDDIHTAINWEKFYNEAIKNLLPSPFMTRIEDVSNDTKYVISNDDKNIPNNYELVAYAIVISRLGQWMPYCFHMCAYNVKEQLLADDMTYNPYKVSEDEINIQTLSKDIFLYRISENF